MPQESLQHKTTDDIQKTELNVANCAFYCAQQNKHLFEKYLAKV